MFRLLIETRDVPASLVRLFVLGRLDDVMEALRAGATLGDIQVGHTLRTQVRVGSYMLEEED